MAKAKKLNSGNWRCLAYIGMENGKRKYKSFTASTKKEAELMALEYERKREEASSTSLTLGELTDNYINLRSNLLSASTIRGYRIVRKTYYPELFSMASEDIDMHILQHYINADIPKHSPKTIKNRFSFIITVLRESYPDRAYNVKYPAKIKKEISIPSDEEIKRICEHVKGTDMEVPVLLAAFVGMRRSEICAVNSIKKDRLLINKAVVQGETGAWVSQDRAKTEAGYRTVYVPPFVQEVIKRSQLPIKLRPNKITDKFRQITRSLNLPDYRFHSLRHYYASVLMAEGIPDKYVIERIGHSTDHMLKTVYQHTTKEKNKEIDGTIDELFDSKFNSIF